MLFILKTDLGYKVNIFLQFFNFNLKATRFSEFFYAYKQQFIGKKHPPRIAKTFEECIKIHFLENCKNKHCSSSKFRNLQKFLKCHSNFVRIKLN